MDGMIYIAPYNLSREKYSSNGKALYTGNDRLNKRVFDCRLNEFHVVHSLLWSGRLFQAT